MTLINTLEQGKEYKVAIPGTCRHINVKYVGIFGDKVIFKTLDFESPIGSHPGITSWYGNFTLEIDRCPENYIHAA